MKALSTWTRRGLLALAFFASLLALLVSLGSTPRATTLLAQMITHLEPQLLLEHRDGNLMHGRFNRIAWRDGDLQIVLLDIGWEVDPLCLRRRTLCFDDLKIGALEIHTGGAAGDDEPFSLAPVALPMAIELQRGALAKLTIMRDGNPVLQLQDIELQGTLENSVLSATHLAARLDETRALIKGHIDLREQLPIDARVHLSHGDTLGADIRVHGDLAKLDFSAQSNGDYTVDAAGWIAPLATPITLEVTARSRAPLQLAADGEGFLTLDEGKLVLHGSLDAIEATLDGSLHSPTLGDNTLHGQASWSAGVLQLQRVVLNGEAGDLAVSGTLGTDSTLALDIETRLSDFCAPGWQPAVQCRMSGRAQIAGTLGGPTPLISIAAELAGSVNDFPAAIDGKVQTLDGGRWRLDDVAIRSGINTLQLNGDYGERVALEGTLAVGDLSQTLSGASGTGGGSVAISGTTDALQLLGSLRMERLAYKDMNAATLEIKASSPAWPAQAASLELSLRDGHTAGLDIEALTIKADGTDTSHALRLNSRSSAGNLELECRGARQANHDWQGRCTRLQVDPVIGTTRWALDHEIALNWRQAMAVLTIEPFCLKSGTSSLCSEHSAVFEPNAFRGLALHATALPLGLLDSWIPAELQAGGNFDLRFAARREPDGAAVVDGEISARTLSIAAQAAGSELPLTISNLSATLHGTSDAARLDWQFGIGEAGSCTGAFALQQPGTAGTLSGRIELRAIDIAALAFVMPGVVDAAGTLEGAIDVEGQLTDPRLSGSIELRDGRFSHESLPAAVDSYALKVDFGGSEAQLSGHFETVAGGGTIDGTVFWIDEEWAAKLHLKAERLLLEPIPGSKLTLAPDVQIALGPTLATVTGEVLIPQADIRLERLPETAISASPDTVIIGAEAREAGFDYALDLKLQLGDQVQFRGLGAEARLTGSLDLHKQPGDSFQGRGEISVVDGRYAAYGQALEITEGRFIFRDTLNRPNLRITAERKIEDEPIRVGVRVRGDARNPDVQVFSSPPMEENRALYYLLTGRAPAADTDMDLAVASAMMQLGLSGASKLTGGIMQQFGIEDFQIDARKVEGGTEVHLSGYLSPDIQFRYGVSTFDKVNTFRLRYRLARQVFVEGISGVENAVDLLYSFDR